MLTFNNKCNHHNRNATRGKKTPRSRTSGAYHIREKRVQEKSDILGMNIQSLRKLQHLERQANEQMRDYGLITDSEASMIDGSRQSETSVGTT